MKIKTVLLGAACLFIAINGATAQVAPPVPYGALPSARQLKWHETEVYSLIHYTPATFQNKEWGYGDADPTIFNPPNFDALQITKAAKAGGIKGIICVTKHHDGYAMWPTKTSPYNISASSWKNGKGDLVKEFQLATQKTDLKFGIYCSPWDRNNLNYGTEAYIEDYRNQLKELYTNYGELFMSWHDGANGGDGYYGGKKEVRKVDPASYYKWPETWETLTRKLQPNAVIFSDAGLDVRWVGNEAGYAPETAWATITHKSEDGRPSMPGFTNIKNLGSGDRNGIRWIPFECDVPLRHGWFYHAEEDSTVKSTEKLFQIYCASVGRGGGLDLGLAPNPEGKLHRNDVDTLAKFGKMIKDVFAKNLALGAKITLSNVRGKDNAQYGAANLLDNDRYSYWATDDAVHQGTAELSFAKPVKFSVIRLRENIKLGQRLDSIAVDVFKDGAWKRLTGATSIGACRIIRLGKAELADRLRICVYAPVAITLSDLGLFLEPNKQ